MNMPFTTLEFAALVLAVEFALFAWIGPVLILRQRRAAGAAVRDADEAGAGELLEEVEEKEPSRRDALSTIFASTYRLEGPELDQAVDEFIEREQSFYQVMTSVYLERRPERLQEIPDELMKVISPWIRMTPQGVVPAEEVDALTTENTELNAELAQTKENMDALMAEYLAAFEKAKTLEAESEAAKAAADEAAADAPAEGENEPDFGLADDTPATDITNDDDDEVIAAEVGADDPESAVTDIDDTVTDGRAPPVAIDLADDNDEDEAPEEVTLSSTGAPVFDVSADPEEDEFSQDDIDALFADDDEDEDEKPAAA